MTPEALHDAITLLPEELLDSVDRLRKKKRVPWKSVAVLAACSCLVAGLWLFSPGNKVAMDSANGSAAPEREPMEYGQSSIANAGVVVKVLHVDENYLQVGEVQPEKFSDESISIQLPSVRLTFENLQQVPLMQVGQTIRIYFKPEQFDEENLTVKPYKIEMIKEDIK